MRVIAELSGGAVQCFGILRENFSLTARKPVDGRGQQGRALRDFHASGSPQKVALCVRGRVLLVSNLWA